MADPVTKAAAATTAAPPTMAVTKKRSGPAPPAPWAAVVNSEAASLSALQSSSADAVDVNDSEVAQTVRDKDYRRFYAVSYTALRIPSFAIFC